MISKGGMNLEMLNIEMLKGHVNQDFWQAFKNTEIDNMRNYDFGFLLHRDNGQIILLRKENREIIGISTRDDPIFQEQKEKKTELSTRTSEK